TSDQPGRDLVVSYADRPGVLYRDRLAGRYEAHPIDTIAPGVRAAAARDFDADGAVDLIALNGRSATLLANRQGRFEQAGTATAEGASIALADFENRGLHDVQIGGTVLRSAGAWQFTTFTPAPLAAIVTSAAADFDQDGRTDLLAVT